MVPKPPNINKKQIFRCLRIVDKNVLVKKLEANNRKLGAHKRNHRGYVFGFRVSGLGFATMNHEPVTGRPGGMRGALE